MASMASILNTSKVSLLLKIGALALVIQLIVFQGSFGLVSDPGLSDSLESVLSSGLLIAAVVLLLGGLFLYLSDS